MPSLPSRTSRPAALVLVALSTAGPALAEPVPETQNGLPLLPIPTYDEVGLSPFTLPTGTSSTVQDTPAPPGRTAIEGGSGDGADSLAIAAMMARSWGEAASQNAQMVGVTPVSVAATCVMESGCSSNPASNGTISGTFQMRDDTFTDMIRSAVARDSNLAANIVPGLAGKLDPATQNVAAAEYLRQGAVALQTTNLANPSVLDVRGYYNFGPAPAVNVARAVDDAVMSDLVPLTAAQYCANGIVPSAAQAPVLLTRS